MSFREERVSAMSRLMLAIELILLRGFGSFFFLLTLEVDSVFNNRPLCLHFAFIGGISCLFEKGVWQGVWRHPSNRQHVPPFFPSEVSSAYFTVSSKEMLIFFYLRPILDKYSSSAFKTEGVGPLYLMASLEYAQ